MWNVNYIYKSTKPLWIVGCRLWPAIFKQAVNLYEMSLSLSFLSIRSHLTSYRAMFSDFRCNCLLSIQSKALPIRTTNEWPSLQPKIWSTFKWMILYIRFRYDYYRRWLHWTLDTRYQFICSKHIFKCFIPAHVPFFPLCKLKIHCRLINMFVHWIIQYMWYKCTLHLIQKWLLLIQWI